MKFNKYYLLFLIGCLSSYYWISPVTQIPGVDFELNFFNRVIRTIYPLFIGLFIFNKVLKTTVNRFLLLFIFSFLIIPIFITLIFNLNLGVIVYLPVLVSFLGLIFLATLKPSEFYFWYFGTSFVSSIFLSVGLLKFGFDATTFYGRPRVHFGFIHPVQSSSIIISSFSFFILILHHSINSLKYINLFYFITYLCFSVLLFLAQSSNLFIAFNISVLTFLLFKIFNSITIKSLLLIVLLFVPFSFFFFINLPVNLMEFLDDFSSGRILNYKELFFTNLNGEDFFSFLFGPTKFLRHLIDINDVTGFASRDSVFFSFFLAFGFFGLSSLVLFFFLIGILLIKYNLSSFSVFCGVLFFFSADAQGLTPNNLLIYACLAFVLNQYSNSYKFNE
ncbi:hypothetical protein [Aquirufa sp.]|uniref:hypothetical protein n=1 Tax=Aquirufa sp. TaxID=2676249 RepID=UPI003784052F